MEQAMSNEANFSFTTKIGNDLFTVRGDTYDEFLSNAMACGQVSGVGVLIGALNGEMTPLVEQQAAATVAASLGGGVVTPPAGDPFGGSFAPIPPAPGASAGDRTCAHGVMVKRTGVGQKGEWRAWFCPTPKDTPGQCKPVFADKRNPAEWGAF